MGMTVCHWSDTPNGRRYYAVADDLALARRPEDCPHNLIIGCMAMRPGAGLEHYRAEYNCPPTQPFYLLLPNDEETTHEVCSLCGSVRFPGEEWYWPSGRISRNAGVVQKARAQADPVKRGADLRRVCRKKGRRS